MKMEKRRIPVTRVRCYTCYKPPKDKPFSNCARCKMVVYCSRKCQKKDWPEHKKACTDTHMDTQFAAKCLHRLPEDLGIMLSLEMALAEDYFAAFLAAPDCRQMWFFDARLCITPCKEEDWDALTSPDVPLTPLLDKPMPGVLTLLHFDICTEEDRPWAKDNRAKWGALRELDDEHGNEDCHTVLMSFFFRDIPMYSMPLTVHPAQVDLASRKHSPGVSAQYDGRRMLKSIQRRVNFELGSGDEAGAKKLRHHMGTNDKIGLRKLATEYSKTLG